MMMLICASEPGSVCFGSIGLLAGGSAARFDLNYMLLLLFVQSFKKLNLLPLMFLLLLLRLL